MLSIYHIPKSDKDFRQVTQMNIEKQEQKYMQKKFIRTNFQKLFPTARDQDERSDGETRGRSR